MVTISFAFYIRRYSTNVRQCARKPQEQNESTDAGKSKKKKKITITNAFRNYRSSHAVRYFNAVTFTERKVVKILIYFVAEENQRVV